MCRRSTWMLRCCPLYRGRRLQLYRGIWWERKDSVVTRHSLGIAQTLYLARDNQLFVAAKRNTVFRGETFRTFTDKVNMRTVAQNFTSSAEPDSAVARRTQRRLRSVAPSMMKASS